MVVQYKQTLTKSVNDEFSTVLKEANDFFKQKYQVNILGEGIKEVISNSSQYNSYVDYFTEDLDATDQETVRVLMENARMNIIRESNLGGIAPISSFTVPIIRKMWAKIALKYAIPTEPVNAPAFTVPFSKPFVQLPTGERKYLPEGMRDPANTLAEKKRLTKDLIALPAMAVDLLGPVGSSIATGDSIDTKFIIDRVSIEAKDKDGANPEVKEVVVNIKADLNRRLYGEVSAKHTDGTVTEDVVMGGVDLAKGTLTLTSLKQTVKGVKILGWVSSEAHNTATNVSFELTKREIEIPTGEHIEASLPLEFLQDAMALYNIDGASEVIDIMSNLNSLKVDQEILMFLDKAYEGTGGTYHAKFDVHPAPQFAGNPQDWLTEIRRVINFLAKKMKNDTYYYQGYFVIIGNPLDTMLIPNVSWSFNNVSDTQNGVEVEYSIGAMSGSDRFNIISSDIIPQGKLTIFFCPSTDKFKTFAYYPYTFNVVNNYLNTQKQNVPSVMMTKRHTLEEFTPLIGKIDILNNDGTLTRPY